MGFVVRSGVESNDFHELGCRRIGGKKQGAENAESLVPIVPAVQVVPNVRFRFMNKIDCETPKNAASPFLQYNRSLPWGRKWPINDFNKFLGPESYDDSGSLSASSEEYL
jgi:hypothetical protein